MSNVLNQVGKSIVYTPQALDRDGICLAQLRGSAGDLVLNGVLAAGNFGCQTRVTLYSAANLSAATFTVYGTTQRGAAISEAITGPNATTVSTTRNFYTVTQVAVSAAIASNVEAGIGQTLETPWVPLSSDAPLKGISVQLSAGASMTYAVQYGVVPLGANDESSILALVDSTLTAKTTSAGVAVTTPFPSIRLAITSFVSGTATLRVIETRN